MQHRLQLTGTHSIFPQQHPTNIDEMNRGVPNATPTSPPKISPDTKSDIKNEDDIQKPPNEFDRKTDCSGAMAAEIPEVQDKGKGCEDVDKMHENANVEEVTSERSHDTAVQTKTVTWKEDLVQEPESDDKISHAPAPTIPENEVVCPRTEEDLKQLPEILQRPLKQISNPVLNTGLDIPTNVLESLTKDVPGEVVNGAEILHGSTEVYLDKASSESPQNFQLLQSSTPSENSSNYCSTPVDSHKDVLTEVIDDNFGWKKSDVNHERRMSSRRNSQEPNWRFQKSGSLRKKPQWIDWKNLSEYKNPKSFREELNLPPMSPVPASDSPQLFTNKVTNKSLNSASAFLFTFCFSLSF